MSMTIAMKSSRTVPSGLFQSIKVAAARLLAGYQRRQTMHELSSMDDHLLKDIGISRVAVAKSSLWNDLRPRDLIR